METFTIQDMLINSTDIYKILCGLGIGNLSECKNDSDSAFEPKGRLKKKNQQQLLYTFIFYIDLHIFTFICRPTFIAFSCISAGILCWEMCERTNKFRHESVQRTHKLLVKTCKIWYSHLVLSCLFVRYEPNREDRAVCVDLPPELHREQPHHHCSGAEPAHADGHQSVPAVSGRQ